MIVGYARVSTTDQTPQLQIDALKAAKCKPIYVEQKSGKNMNRPELTRCIDTLRKGDTLVIWKLDRLGRSLRDLLEIVERLENSGVQFISLTEDINTKGGVSCSARWSGTGRFRRNRDAGLLEPLPASRYKLAIASYFIHCFDLKRTIQNSQFVCLQGCVTFRRPLDHIAQEVVRHGQENKCTGCHSCPRQHFL